MPELTLEEVIRRNVAFPQGETKLGWWPILHQACDHGRKGARAAFKFEGDATTFHCFNCGLASKYDPLESPYLSKNMKQVMSDFFIPEEEYQAVVMQNLAKERGDSNSGAAVQEFKDLEPEEIELPPIFYPLEGASGSWAELARYYLREERSVDPSSYPFMLARKSDQDFLKKWHGRVIIPVYKDGKLIFFIGRDLTGKKQRKYESPSVSRDTVLYGYDKLYIDRDKPLYIVEGWFDAEAIDGVAIFGNELSETKIRILNKSPRTKVYIPDRYGDGLTGAEQALAAGWSISTPDIGTCKDMSEAVQKYGKLYVLKTLVDNTTDDEFSATVQLGTFCVR